MTSNLVRRHLLARRDGIFRRSVAAGVALGLAAAIFAELTHAVMLRGRGGEAFAAVFLGVVVACFALGKLWERLGRARVERLVEEHYRAPDPQKACATCGLAAHGGHCLRCAAPLCVAHLPSLGARCAECERDFQQRLGTRSAIVVYAASWLGPWAVFAALAAEIAHRFPRSGGMRQITTGYPVVDAALMTLVASFVLAGAAFDVWRRVRRMAFEAERASGAGGSLRQAARSG